MADPNAKQLYLRPEEAKFVGMAVMSMLEQLQATSQNPRINWTPDARKIIKEMIEAGSALEIKLGKLGFDMRPLPPFEDGDEEEFLTKQS